MEDIYHAKKGFIYIFGVIGWALWVYVFWYILLFPNPRGYYFNPFVYNEFIIEFCVINIIFILLVICIILETKKGMWAK